MKDLTKPLSMKDIYVIADNLDAVDTMRGTHTSTSSLISSELADKPLSLTESYIVSSNLDAIDSMRSKSPEERIDNLIIEAIAFVIVFGLWVLSSVLF